MLTAEQQQVAEAHVGFAEQIARRMLVDFRSLDETRSDALFGLVKAARRHDPSRPFRPYARRYIEGAIQRGRRDRSGVRSGQLHAPPRLVALADHEPDGYEPSAHVEAVNNELWRMVDELPDREAAAIRLCYQQDLSQREIAPMLGVSQMHVCRLLSQGRRRLQERIDQ